MTKILLLFVLFLIIFYASIVLYFKFGRFKFFYHNVMHWHTPSEEISYDGCSFASICKHCGKPILQDSQGNWFIEHNHGERHE